MNKLMQVAKGIVDARDCVEENTESVKTVQAYAWTMDLELSEKSAKRVQRACKKWWKYYSDENMNLDEMSTEYTKMMNSLIVNRHDYNKEIF